MSLNGTTYQIPSDEEIERVERETRARDEFEPRVQQAVYHAETGRLQLTFRSGAQASFVLRELRGLENANASELAAVEIVGNGSSLHWSGLDVQMTTIALLQIVFQLRTVQSNAAKAGATRSPRKTLAAQANGRKGGRPRTVPVSAR